MLIEAMVTEGKGNFVLDEVTLQSPRAGEVLVEVKACGICHTDFDCIYLWKDRVPKPEDFLRVGPRSSTYIMGHEGAGIVTETGPGVDHVKAGDRVLLNWAIPCGACFQCSRGAENVCERRMQLPDERFVWRGRTINTSFAPGTMATHALVPKQAVVPLDDGIPFAEACILGCGVMTGFGSAVNAAKIESGSNVAVIGGGCVGLSVVQGAVYCGARTILAVDVSPERLKMAMLFGTTSTLLADRSDQELRQNRAAGAGDDRWTRRGLLLRMHRSSRIGAGASGVCAKRRNRRRCHQPAPDAFWNNALLPCPWAEHAEENRLYPASRSWRPEESLVKKQRVERACKVVGWDRLVG